jgi:hypothetical protein
MMGNLIHLITRDNFTEEVISEKRPILFLCMPQDDDFPSQLKSMEIIANRHGSWLKVALLGDAFIENFKKELDVAGTPTFLIFHEGEEKNRMLGLADHNGLEQFVLEVREQAARGSTT